MDKESAISLPASADAQSPAESGSNKYKVWTLRYGPFSLAMVFFWLLWGDFTFQLMETIIPSILPLTFDSMDASNLARSIILNVIPAAMNLLVNPTISFRSDRFRSRWGRRIPFLFWATPPVTVCLIIMAFSPQIGAWLQANLLHGIGGAGGTTVIMITFAVAMLMFQFFHMFVASVYYYLFNDVVPEAFVARFMGAFRAVGTLASMTYNWFLLQYAQTHMQAIFVSIALLYFAGFMLMCWRVREGKYPPPPPLEGNRKGLRASIRTYCKESFTHRFYLWTFACSACLVAANACAFAGNPFYVHLGISLEQLGHFRAYLGIPGLVLAVPLAWLAGRLHPVRVVFWVLMVMPLISLAQFFFVHDYRSMVAWALVSFPDGLLYSVAFVPMGMLIWPKERYGQFGSAEAVAKSICFIILSPLAGVFLDMMRVHIYHGDKEYYRWMFVWSASFQLAAFAFMCLIYRYWSKNGGVNFVPPSVDIVETPAPAPEKSPGVPAPAAENA